MGGGLLERMGAPRAISDAKPWIEDPKTKFTLDVPQVE